MKAAIRKSRTRGYTLIELTLAMAVGVIISAIIMAMVNQQLAFLRIFRKQSFLVTEAPMLNNYITKIVENADSYKLYASVADLKTPGGPQVLKDAPVILLRFKEPNGNFRAAALSFETPTGMSRGLYYRLMNSSNQLQDITASDSWALSKKPEDVRFSIDTGILRVTIKGPNREQIIYSGASQL